MVSYSLERCHVSWGLVESRTYTTCNIMRCVFSENETRNQYRNGTEDEEVRGWNRDMKASRGDKTKV